MNVTRFAVAALIAATATAAPLAAQEQFQWNGRVPAGQTIEIKGVNGGIRAVAASGSDVRVTATKTGRRADPSQVRIEVLEHQNGVTICAVYPHRRERNECAPGSGGRMSVENNDVQVEFVVQVPRGVNLAARTVNGGIEGAGLASDVRAHTVNGTVRISTSGLAQARTVNGAIEVAMSRADWTRRLEFETVNGSITISFGGDINTDVSASTVNGDITTDFPLEVRGRFGPKRVSGTVGSGGRELAISTVNGSITLQRR
jgi:hypothetical protein